MSRSGLFRGILGMLGIRDREVDGILDLALLGLRSQGPLDQAILDRLGYALREHSELAEVGWGTVKARLTQIETEAPTFSATRARIPTLLKSPRLRRFGLALTADLLDRAVERESTLKDLAQLLELDAATAADLIDPWQRADPLAETFVRLPFNLPRTADALSFDQAAWRISSNQELSLLCYKLLATRLAAQQLGDAKIEAFGEVAELDGRPFRVDALLSTPQRSYLTRCVGPNEALHPEELELFRLLVPRLEDRATILIVHSEDLTPADKIALEAQKSDRLRTWKLDL